MKQFKNLFTIYLFIFCIRIESILSSNGAIPDVVTNEKLNNELKCKTDDGRIEIPLNGKIRLGSNPCKICTCKNTGFLCEDQCDPVSASTPIDGTATTTASSNSFSSGQPVISFSFPPTPTVNPSLNIPTLRSPFIPPYVANNNFNNIPILRPALVYPQPPMPNMNIYNIPRTRPTVPTPSVGNLENDPGSNTLGGSCSFLSENGLLAAREYAFVDCSEIYLSGKRTNGVYEIWPRLSSKPFRVFCDMQTDGGGWTVIQRRDNYVQQSNFFAPWSSYKRGFGDLTRDFWLGNEKIYELTNQDEYRLHINLEDFSGQSRFVEYEWFFITNEQTKYVLNLGRYMATSNGGDSLSYNRGMRFTTRDQDNDQSMSSQCAENYKSGWWHTGCTLANLNGLYLRGNDSTATGVFWNNWLGAKYSLKLCDMKIRPANFNSEMLS